MRLPDESQGRAPRSGRRMPSDLSSPFAGLEEALGKAFLSLNVGDTRCPEAKALRGFQRAFSACPLVLSASRRGDYECLDDATATALRDQCDPIWPTQWCREATLPCSSLHSIPFRTERSVSMIEGRLPEASSSSSRYKTELCRTFEESGHCKYGAKCQFAHGPGELRGLSRHPKYKTEPCRTFHTSGLCPYGARCHFIHNAEEQRPLPQRPPHCLSSAGCAADPLPASLPLLARPPGLQIPEAFAPCSILSRAPTSCETLPPSARPLSFSGSLVLQKSLSADSLLDQEDSGSLGSNSSSSGSSESSSLGPPGRRLPIFSQLSVSDD